MSAYVRLQAIRAEYGDADPNARTPEGQIAWLLSVFAPPNDNEPPAERPLDNNVYVRTQDGYRIAIEAEIEAVHLHGADER